MDYPKNLREFDRLFAHKDACLRFLEEVRWGKNFRCQRCGSEKFWALHTGLRRCQSCRFKNSVKTGTIFESSRLPLKMWFYSIWWITAQKAGVSALDLQKDVGLGSYRSAWLLLHKIRNAMGNSDRTLLEGEVELGETNVGTERIVMAAEISGPKNVGRIRMARLRSGEGVEAFLRANIVKGTLLRTSGKKPFGDLAKLGYRHIPEKSPRSRAGDLLPHVHLVSEQMQRWLKGTLHGRVDPKHLESYLAEFVFRFHARAGKARGLLFQRVLENAVHISPSSYQKIVSRKTPGHSSA